MAAADAAKQTPLTTRAILASLERPRDSAVCRPIFKMAAVVRKSALRPIADEERAEADGERKTKKDVVSGITRKIPHSKVNDCSVCFFVAEYPKGGLLLHADSVQCVPTAITLQCDLFLTR